MINTADPSSICVPLPPCTHRGRVLDPWEASNHTYCLPSVAAEQLAAARRHAEDTPQG